MPATPWKVINPAIDEGVVTVIATHLPLRSHRRIPRFMRWT